MHDLEHQSTINPHISWTIGLWDASVRASTYLWWILLFNHGINYTFGPWTTNYGAGACDQVVQPIRIASKHLDKLLLVWTNANYKVFQRDLKPNLPAWLARTLQRWSTSTCYAALRWKWNHCACTDCMEFSLVKSKRRVSQRRIC